MMFMIRQISQNLFYVIVLALVFSLGKISIAADKQKPSLLDNSYKEVIYKALVEQKVFDDMGRTLANISHVCNLIIDDKKFPVIDVVVIFSTGNTLKWSPFMVILDENLKVLQKIPTLGEHPVYCYGNVLFTDGSPSSLSIDGHSTFPEGNAILISNMGKDIAVIRFAPEQYPKHIKFQ
ncbi:MAG: hypothetical protein D6B27_00385 [Gammaproteobacteria bacterium]|nr:MAG: hypothetical protein D6B27_00385 [Gammaproteobacteria bacterium]